MADPLPIKVYNVTATFPLVAGEAKAEEVLPLAAAITDTIEPASWDLMGGPGSLRLVHRDLGVKAWLLVVRQTADIQGKINDALTQMKGP